ncbi:MAG: tetratricopeptide repeat protein [Planctomycetes bacterium]|nr:tetratricopeptide repeat protein [Planctomycetota bacterium]
MKTKPAPVLAYRSARALFAALGALAALCLSGCGSKGGSRALETRAVVIGIDGADWKVIDALAAVGAMPNLTRLRQRGVSGPIATLSDIALSPVIWTSVATGKTAAKHGIAWFMVDQPDGTRVPVRSTNRKAEALWNILAKNELAPTVLGWWATYPAEDVGRGTIVSDALGFHGFGASARDGDDGKKTHPGALFAELDGLVPTEQQVSAEFAQRFIHIDAQDYRDERFDPARFPKRDPANPIHLFQQYAVTAQGYTAIAEELLAQQSFDLFLMYFEQVDSFSHLFMKYAPPKLAWIDEQGFARYRDVVGEWYRYQDELLGRVLAKIDLETTAVFVLSDHGFKSGTRRIRSDELVDVKKAHLDHETHGIFIAAGPHVRRGGEVADASVLDITPTLLHYLGLPVAKDMDGKVLERLFEPEFVEAHPIRYVTTYEDGARARALAQAEPIDASAQTEIEGGLAALGYLGEGEDGSKGANGKPAAEPESSPEIHNNLGRIHLREGEPKKALAEFEQALARDPNNADALLNIAAIHQGEGKRELAEHFVQRALAVDPSSTGALAQLAELRRDQGQLDEAIRLFAEALALDDSQPFLYMGAGDVLQRAGRYEQAVQAFQHVLALEPDSFKARYNLGVTYSNMGRAEEAVAIYEQALALAPKDFEAPSARNNLGALLLAKGETERALAHFEAALKAAPYNLESRFNAALIYLDQGRGAEAIQLLEQAAKLEPNHEQVNLRLGLSYLAAERGQDAYRSLLLVRRLYPENWAATLGLAVLHARAQELDPARALLSEALELGAAEARMAAADFPILQPLLDK